MASYTNANYKNDFYNLNGLYFNSTIQTNSTTLDEKYLQKSGGTINGSLDIKTNLTIPIGDIGILINDLQEDIDLKQSKLSAGTNVTISSNNIISSSDAKKQNLLTFVDSLVLNSIVVKPASSKLIYTPAISGEIKATTLTIEDPFTLESINVKDELNLKQNILIPGENITIIDNVISLIGGITQADLDTKQDFINDGDLSFAKTSGLQAAINAQYKLASIIYVDNQLNKKQNTLTAGNNITIVNNVISSTSSSTSIVNFKVYRSITTVINANRSLPYDVIIDNIGDGYDVSTGKFTVPFSGSYFFYCVFWTSANSIYNAEFYNETTGQILMRIERPSTGAGGTTSVHVSLNAYCNQGDIIYVRRSSGTIQMIGSTLTQQFTTFGGILIY